MLNTFISKLNKEKGLDLEYIIKLIDNIDSHYKELVIPKSNGKKRILNVPDRELKEIQRFINMYVLCGMYVSNSAKAYLEGFSIKDNAIPHVAKNKIIKLDIKDFFNRIDELLIYRECFKKSIYEEEAGILTSLCSYKGKLPQGAPTSPSISNIVMREFDGKVQFYCNLFKIEYTRYCDDMTFSGDIDKEEEKNLIEFIEIELGKMGMYLNSKKTKILTSSQRKSVTGIVINEKLNVEREYLRRIRQEVYYINKFGIEEHLRKKGIYLDPLSYLESLRGRISYAMFISNRDELKEYLDIVNTAISNVSIRHNNEFGYLHVENRFFIKPIRF